MSQPDLDRVRNDLETIRNAAGVGLPFSRDDVRTGLWCAACGLLICAWAVIGPRESRWLLYIPLSIAVLACAHSYVTARRKRHHEPVRWREHRLSIIASAVAVPAAIGYLFWERHVGVPRGMSGAASVFFIGVGLTVFAMLEPRRRYFLGGAIPLMAFGLAIPLCSPSGIVMAGGLCMAVGCFGGAVIQSWQLNRYGK
jgi:hypothetical protein